MASLTLAMMKPQRKVSPMAEWKLGDGFREQTGEGFLRGIPAIASFLGKSYNTTKRLITIHGLPAWKEHNRSGGHKLWCTHKQIIMMWVLAKVSLEDPNEEYMANPNSPHGVIKKKNLAAYTTGLKTPQFMPLSDSEIEDLLS